MTKDALEGADAEEDDDLPIGGGDEHVAVFEQVSDTDAANVIVDMTGGELSFADVKAILERFAEEGWRIVREVG